LCASVGNYSVEHEAIYTAINAGSIHSSFSITMPTY